MKKIISLTISLILLSFFISCTGYKPIFNPSNVNFDIADYSIEGNKKLGKQVHSKLSNLSKLKKTSEGRQINLLIKVVKTKSATSKSTAGKVLEYKILLNTNVIIRDYLTDKNILNFRHLAAESYKVQDQYSETIKSEKKTLDNLVNNTYENLLIKISESLQQQ